MEIDVKGAADIARMAARVRELGDGRTIPNQMAKEIRQAVPPIRKAVKANALAYLPSGGGLNVWVAKAGVRASIRRGPRSAGVSLVSGRNSQKKRSDIRAIDRGRVRAPTYGNRKSWHLQTVKAGFFTDAVTGEGFEEFRAATIRAIDKAVREAFG